MEQRLLSAGTCAVSAEHILLVQTALEMQVKPSSFPVMTEPMNINMARPVSSQPPDLLKMLLVSWLGYPWLPRKPCQKVCISLKQRPMVVPHIFLAFLDSHGCSHLDSCQRLAMDASLGAMGGTNGVLRACLGYDS